MVYLENTDSILDMDATGLAEKIRNSEITSLEATNTYIEHLQKINPQLNCLVEERFEEARKEAREADRLLQAGNAAGRLWGVPISMKDSFDVAGMRTTGGLMHRRDLVQEKDAQVVASLKKEGAIILGKTNTPILCFYQETDSKLHGRCNNPWDVNRTTGGSSGGEGALIAAGGAAVGLGSDIGGSIRFPSHFNGVIGFRSGNGQVSDQGSFPHVGIALQDRMLGIGAMAKSVRDAQLINDIIAHTQPEERNLEEFTLVIPEQALCYPIDEATATALKAVRDYLQSTFPVVDEQPPYFRQSSVLWQRIMSIEGAYAYGQIAFNHRPVHPLQEYLKEKCFKSSELHHYFTWVLVGANLTKPSQKALHRTQHTIDQGDKQIAEYFDRRLLVMPVYHTPAPPHGQVIKEVFSLTMSFKKYLPFIAYVNTWGLPSLTVPIAENAAGLPIGLQITSRVGNEDAIFQLGQILERNFRGYKRAVI